MPGDVLHHEVGHALRQGVHGVDRDNVFMNDGGGRLGLAGEATAGGPGGGHPGGEQLDRHQAIQGAVAGQEDHPHAAPSNQSQDII